MKNKLKIGEVTFSFETKPMNEGDIHICSTSYYDAGVNAFNMIFNPFRRFTNGTNTAAFFKVL